MRRHHFITYIQSLHAINSLLAVGQMGNLLCGRSSYYHSKVAVISSRPTVCLFCMCWKEGAWFLTNYYSCQKLISATFTFVCQKKWLLPVTSQLSRLSGGDLFFLDIQFGKITFLCESVMELPLINSRHYFLTRNSVTIIFKRK